MKTKKKVLLSVEYYTDIDWQGVYYNILWTARELYFPKGKYDHEGKYNFLAVQGLLH